MSKNEALNEAIKKLKTIKATINKEEYGVKKIELLQDKFEYVVFPLLHLRYQGNFWKKIVPTGKSGDFQYIDKVLFGGWLGRNSFLSIPKKISFKGLNKNCPAGRFVLFPIDELRFKNDHPTIENMPEHEEWTQKLSDILQEFCIAFRDYIDRAVPKEKNSSKRQLRAEICSLIYEISYDCRNGIIKYHEKAEALARHQLDFDILTGNMAGAEEHFIGFFSEENVEKKEHYLAELFSIHKKKNLSELFPRDKVEQKIPPIFIFDNKITIMELAFYCLYSNENLEVTDIQTFLKACQTDDRYLPNSDWFFAHKIDFLKLNGKPIYGAGYWKAKVSDVVPMFLQKFGEISSVTINFKNSVLMYKANKDYPFEGKKIKMVIELAQKTAYTLLYFKDMCNIVNFNTTSEVKYLTDLAEDKQEDAVQEPSTEEKSTEKTKSKKPKRK